jgi:HK97 family phage major capsid protein
MDIHDLQERLDAVTDEMQDLADADLDDEARVAFDALETEAKKLNDDIERLSTLGNIKKESRKTVVKAPTPGLVTGDAPEDRKFDSFGHFLQAVRRAGSAGGSRDPRLLEERAISGASESIPSDGGYLVQTDFAAEIWKRANEVGVLLPRCRRIPISANANSFSMNIVDESSRATGSRWGGVQIYRKPEAGTATVKKVKFGQISLKLKKLIGTTYSTDELEADASALAAVVGQGFAEEFAFVVDDEIFRGDGASQMLGIVNSAAYVEVAKETDQDAATILYENIVKMYSRFYGSSGVWLANRDTFPSLATMSLTLNVPVYLPPGGASAAPYGTLFGMPLLFIETASTLGTAGDIVLADMSQYLVIEKGGLNGASSMHVKFVEDEMCYRWTYRNDGRPIWKSALTPYKGSSNTRSPFVGLAVRA